MEMCNRNCSHPESKPEDDKCNEKQILECHGNVKDHPCNTEKE